MAGAGVFRPLVRLLGLVGVPGEGLDAGLTPVFFMTDVRLLRMELIFARSTLARFGKANAGVGGEEKYSQALEEVGLLPWSQVLSTRRGF